MLVSFRILLMKYSAAAVLMMAGLLLPAVAALGRQRTVCGGPRSDDGAVCDSDGVYGVQAWSGQRSMRAFPCS